MPAITPAPAGRPHLTGINFGAFVPRNKAMTEADSLRTTRTVVGDPNGYAALQDAIAGVQATSGSVPVAIVHAGDRFYATGLGESLAHDVSAGGGIRMENAPMSKSGWNSLIFSTNVNYAPRTLPAGTSIGAVVWGSEIKYPVAAAPDVN